MKVTVEITEQQLAAIKARLNTSWSRMLPNIRTVCEALVAARR